MNVNELGLPIGPALPNWRATRRPGLETLSGHWCALHPLDPEQHIPSLFETVGSPAAARLWTYLPDDPPATEEHLRNWATHLQADPTSRPYVIVERKEGRVRGTLSYLRIDPPNGSIEIGMVLFSEGLQRTTAATEAVYLLLRHAFELGYRRVEWKCDSLNAPSRRAAERLGFSFEGVFRQAMVVKGRNRDTAWYSMLDREWPLLQPAFDAWLAPANFDTNGRQRERLSPIIGEICRRIHSQIGSA